MSAEFSRGRLYASALDHPPPSKVTMQRCSLRHLSDASLLEEFETRLARDRSDTAELVACLAEVDRRKLYRPAGYRSMYAFCVGHYHLSEAAAYRRIHAARLMRNFPVVYEALADGRVHLSALVLLARHLRPENVDELLAAVTHKSRAEIEDILAERFPRRDVPTVLVEFSASGAPTPAELFPGRVSDISLALSDNASGASPESRGEGELENSTRLTGDPVPAVLVQAPVHPHVAPISPKRYAIQFTMDETTHDLLRRAQDLLGRQAVPGDIGDVVGRALKAYVAMLERTKFGATERPQALCRPTADGSRHVPARVRRAVWERDGAQCTFVSESGHRCEARSGLEFDHVKEFARGGGSTVDNLRLRCRAHNQFAAEQTFGAGFMQAKREQSKAVVATSWR